MLFETSWDDGSYFDGKLAVLLREYDIPATLYIPIQCEIGLDWVKLASKDENITIGCHTVSHPQDLKKLHGEFLEYEIKSAKEMIETVVGKQVTSFCYPRGRFNNEVKAQVVLAGFLEARTTQVLVVDREWEFNPFEKPTTIHAYQRKEYKGIPWLEIAKQKFDEARARGENGYFHLWGHSAEVEKNNSWEDLEELFKYINANL